MWLRVNRYKVPVQLMLIMLACGMLQAQTPALNEAKYWNYRERLRNEFMVGIGADMGMSAPAGVRDTVSGILQWTDATMDLGQYIGVLAMEYRILEERGRGTDQTVEELFFALYALNRLDYTAETFFGGTPSLNGFFMRDDIDEDSLDMPAVLEQLNQGLATNKITGLDSDHMDEEPRNNEESLDQAILLISGLGLVRKCVPEDVVYTGEEGIQQFQDFETSLYHEAGHIISRIVNYMKEGDSTTVGLDISDPNLYGIQGNAWDFIIKNPVSFQPVLRGENAFLLSKGYTSAKYHLAGLASATTDTSRCLLADSIFLMFENYVVPNDQDFKVINLDAMSNFWPEGLQEDTTNTAYNAMVLGPRSRLQGYEWVPMLHQLAFGSDENYLMYGVSPDSAFYKDPRGYYEYLLNLAPPEGPYNYGDSIWPNWEWSSTSRTIQPGRRGETGNAFPGNYNGLDYMMYYNMYTLLFNDPVKLPEEAISIPPIYPNPFTDRIYSEALTGARYHILDITGRKIKSGRTEEKGSIGLHELDPGIYIIMIIDPENKTHTQKIIKQH